MATDARINVTPNVVVGVSIILLGVVLLLDRMGIAEAQAWLQYWPVLLVVFGASVAIQALRGGADEGAGAAVRERPIVTPGLVLLVAIVSLLVSRGYHRQRGADADPAPDNIALFALMGRDDFTSGSAPFRTAEVTTVMGKSRLDLRSATIPPGEEAVVEVFTLMGETELLIPEDWVIDIGAARVAGGIRDRRASRPRPTEKGKDEVESARPAPDAVEAAAPPTETRPRVLLRGFVMMGGIVIRS
jgi:hypothetical protein